MTDDKIPLFKKHEKTSSLLLNRNRKKKLALRRSKSGKSCSREYVMTVRHGMIVVNIIITGAQYIVFVHSD